MNYELNTWRKTRKNSEKTRLFNATSHLTISRSPEIHPLFKKKKKYTKRRGWNKGDPEAEIMGHFWRVEADPARDEHVTGQGFPLSKISHGNDTGWMRQCTKYRQGWVARCKVALSLSPLRPLFHPRILPSRRALRVPLFPCSLFLPFLALRGRKAEGDVIFQSDGRPGYVYISRRANTMMVSFETSLEFTQWWLGNALVGHISLGTGDAEKWNRRRDASSGWSMDVREIKGVSCVFIGFCGRCGRFVVWTLDLNPRDIAQLASTNERKKKMLIEREATN